MHPACFYKKLKEKDASSFEYLFDRYSGALLSVVIAIVNDPSRGQIVITNTFYKVWERIGQFDEEKTSLFTWMLHIARSEAIEEVKRFGSRAAEQPLTNRGITEIRGLKELVAQLPPPCGNILLMSYFENKSDEEIAETLGQPPKWVRECKRKALVLVNKLLSPGEFKNASLISERISAS